MGYDNPLRVTYTLSGNANAAASKTLPVPAGVARARIAHVGAAAVGFTTTDSATLPLEVGVTGDLGKFYDRSLTVATADPAAADKNNDGGFEVEELAGLIVTRGADGAGPAKAVETTIVIDWY